MTTKGPFFARTLLIAAEWMQPKGCERYGSDNAIWLATVRTE